MSLSRLSLSSSLSSRFDALDACFAFAGSSPAFFEEVLVDEIFEVITDA